MSYREIPINIAFGFVESTASAMGVRTKVELSDHSINVSYRLPDDDKRAWDRDLYKNGNVFVSGYANPIKPRVEHNEQLENPDTVDVAEGDVDEEAAESEADGGPHVSLISSSRYRDYMRQDLVSQLLTPQEQWKLIAYGVLGLGILQFIAIIITLYGTGSF